MNMDIQAHTHTHTHLDTQGMLQQHHEEALVQARLFGESAHIGEPPVLDERGRERREPAVEW